jgi:hypothetical protein
MKVVRVCFLAELKARYRNDQQSCYDSKNGAPVRNMQTSSGRWP